MGNLEKWLDKDDIEQQIWAKKYLERKGLHYESIVYSYYDDLLILEKKHRDDPSYVLAINAMKAAWRQKKLRGKRKGKTEFSLIISKEKKKLLGTISKKKGVTLGEALEELINDEHIRQEEHAGELKKEREHYKQRLDAARGSLQYKIYEKDKIISVLLHLVESYMDDMIDKEIGGLKAHQSMDDGAGESKKYSEGRLKKEHASVNKAIKTATGLRLNLFPLDPVTKIQIKQEINKN